MAKQIASIEGIGPALSEKFAVVHIKTVEQLLKEGATSAGRKEIARTTGLDTSRILKWVNMADLFRIKGIGSEYAELLEAAGVDTVKELKNRDPENLCAKLEEVNAQKKLVRKVPSLKQVKGFVKAASSLKPKVTY